jgi:hypothetical protein
MTAQQVISALRMQVAISRAALTPAPEQSRVEEEAARYVSLPALAVA